MRIRVQSRGLLLKGPADQIVPLAEIAFGLQGDIGPLVNDLVAGNAVMIAGADYSDSDDEMCNVLIERIR